MLDLKIFHIKYNEEEDEQHTLFGLIATEYTHLLFKLANDLLPFSAIFCLNYNGFEWFLREGSPENIGRKYVFYRERILTFFIFPLHFMLNLYSSMLYPLIIIISLLIYNKNQYILLSIICFYYITFLVMIYCMISYIKFLNVWWLCFYRKTEHYRIVDQYLSPLYHFVNTHKIKIDLILKIFGPLSIDMLLYLGYVKTEEIDPDSPQNINNMNNINNINNKYLTTTSNHIHFMNPYSYNYTENALQINTMPLNLNDNASDYELEESKTKSYVDSLYYQHSIQHSIKGSADFDASEIFQILLQYFLSVLLILLFFSILSISILIRIEFEG